MVSSYFTFCMEEILYNILLSVTKKSEKCNPLTAFIVFTDTFSTIFTYWLYSVESFMLVSNNNKQ